ncbi:RNA-directed DNA polymerase, eukaryota, reverse transcriptase zinc-binding domain protein [Tanacetum coccineum]
MTEADELRAWMVSETITTTIKDPIHAKGGPFGESPYDGINTLILNANSTSFGEPLIVNPSSMAESGDGVNVATQAGRFAHVSSSMNGGSSPVHKEANTINIEDSVVHSFDINTKPTSYADATSGNTTPSSTTSSFRHLVADSVFDRVNISIPRKVIEKNYDECQGFFFKFDSRAGLEAVLEGGPWMIHNSLIILNKWSMKTSLQKEELTHILIWVKLHDVPIQVFEKDGISLIATYLGKPIMLDSYTSSTCIPDLDGPGYTKETIRVEYEWKPPRCPTCNIFGHTGETCPKKVVTNPVMNDTNASNDGFQKVINRKRNNKGSSAGNKLPKGVPVSKGFQVGKDLAFKPKAPNVGFNGTRVEPISKAGPSKTNNGGESLSTKDTNARQQDTGKKKISNIASPNPFAALGVDDDEEEEVKNIWDESENLNLQHTGASTPAQTIILGWNDDLVDVMIMAQTNQVMHVQVNIRSDNKALFCSTIYADNYYVSRRALWNNLVGHASLMRDKPWVLLGDFNAALNLEDHSCGGYQPDIAMREFKECVQLIEVMDVNATGLHFTWNQKPKGSKGILKKIDRIMCNHPFLDDFRGSFAIFQPYRISDHSPCVLRIPKNLNVHGCAMYRVVKRLKGLKTPLRKLLHDQGNLHDLEASLDEERFLRQKSKIEWLNAGDANTAYFHRIVKSKCARNRIEMVRDSSNVLHEGNAVPGAFVSHYEQFLGLEGASTPFDDQGLFTRVLPNNKAFF